MMMLIIIRAISITSKPNGTPRFISQEVKPLGETPESFQNLSDARLSVAGPEAPRQPCRSKVHDVEAGLVTLTAKSKQDNPRANPCTAPGKQDKRTRERQGQGKGRKRGSELWCREGAGPFLLTSLPRHPPVAPGWTPPSPVLAAGSLDPCRLSSNSGHQRAKSRRQPWRQDNPLQLSPASPAAWLLQGEGAGSPARPRGTVDCPPGAPAPSHPSSARKDLAAGSKASFQPLHSRSCQHPLSALGVASGTKRHKSS